MHTRKLWRQRIAVVIAMTVAVFGLTTCDRPTPTEPSRPSAFETQVTITTSPGVSSNTITIRWAACDCAPGNFGVRIDGVEVGTMSCSETQSFAFTPGRHTLSFVAHQGSQSFETTVSGEGLGLLAEISCRRR
jgi:hypothetical protein